jgi:hypothetical protein
VVVTDNFPTGYRDALADVAIAELDIAGGFGPALAARRFGFL